MASWLFSGCTVIELWLVISVSALFKVGSSQRQNVRVPLELESLGELMLMVKGTSLPLQLVFFLSLFQTVFYSILDYASFTSVLLMGGISLSFFLAFVSCFWLDMPCLCL